MLLVGTKKNLTQESAIAPIALGHRMRDFLLTKLRRAPIIKPLWDEYDRMAAELKVALAERENMLSPRHPLADETDLVSSLYSWNPVLTTATLEEEEGAVTNLLYAKLACNFDIRLLVEISDRGQSELTRSIERLRQTPRDYKRAILTYGAAFFPEEVEACSGVKQFAPPTSVHAMVRSEFYAGDFYFCDMIVNALYRIGQPLKDGASYLDFGASSGRVVRNLHAAYPMARWYACDPQESAVAWGRDNNPGVHFFRSPLAPPLEIPDQFFEGVLAISIWSHFSEAAAIAWFAEMHRCIRPGGWLAFTTHGPRTLCHYAEQKLKVDEHIREIFSVLCRDGYTFEDVFGAAGDWGVPSTDWGLGYMQPTWLAQRLPAQGWWLADYKVGRATSDQDLYVLVKSVNSPQSESSSLLR